MPRYVVRAGGWSCAVLLLALAFVLPAAAQLTGPQTGLPIPRYVSLKADKVNVRNGPSREHEVAWVFTRAGIPVEITAEADNWRRIRDSEGAEGWVYHSLLSGRRTVLVAPSSKFAGEVFSLYARPDTNTQVVAKLYPRVLGTVRRCDGEWCRISGNGFDGYMEQFRLWGVYPGETVN